MKSTLFIAEFTTVDHAFLMPNGSIMGNSFNVGAYVTGEVTEDEKVVEDFGTVKKRMKAFIDAQEDGFDHKLWVPASLTSLKKDRFEGNVGKAYLNLPANAVKIVPFENTDQIKADVENEIALYLKSKMPGLEFKLFTNVVPKLANPIGKSEHLTFFRYTHGLKDSTSWGCQNIAHGHLSFLHLKANCDTCGPKAQLLQEEIGKSLNNKMFLKRENVYESKSKNQIQVSYDTKDRGYFEYAFDKDLVDYLILDTETTIEYLTDFVKTFWANDMKKCNIETVMVSEGLMKGSLAEVM